MYVLVVEDEPIIALDATMALEDAGHEVAGPALRADEALKIAKSSHPDVALVDINLAGGEEGVRLARVLWRRYGVPCLFVTAQTDQARQNRDTAMGVLSKPYETTALVESLKAASDVAHGRRPERMPRTLELFEPARHAA